MATATRIEIPVAAVLLPILTDAVAPLLERSLAALKQEPRYPRLPWTEAQVRQRTRAKQDLETALKSLRSVGGR